MLQASNAYVQTLIAFPAAFTSETLYLRYV